MSTSRYQVEIRGSDGTAVAGSDLFGIAEQTTEQGSGTIQGGMVGGSDDGEAGRVGIPDKVTIAVGVVVSVVGAATLGFMGWCFRQRRREEKEKMAVAKRLELF
jgi:hypothetical protein